MTLSFCTLLSYLVMDLIGNSIETDNCFADPKRKAKVRTLYGLLMLTSWFGPITWCL